MTLACYGALEIVGVIIIIKCLSISSPNIDWFLADRTNGRAIGTMLRPSVCLSSVTLCIVAKRCVLEQKLLLRAYRKLYMRNRLVGYQNEWPWPLFRGRIKVTWTVALHLTLNISETVRDRGLVPKDYEWEMAYGLSNGHETDDVTWPWKVKLVTPICLECNISKTTRARDFKFGMQLCIGNA